MINYGDDFVLKLYRKLEEGVNPGREVPEFLTEQTEFTAIPPALGSLEFRAACSDGAYTKLSVGTLSSFVRNATNGWSYTVDHLGLFFEHALAIPQRGPRVAESDSSRILWSPLNSPVPQIIAELLGNSLEAFGCWRSRTAEMHIALASRPDVPAFAPEPFTTFYRQSIYHGIAGPDESLFRRAAEPRAARSPATRSPIFPRC